MIVTPKYADMVEGGPMERVELDGRSKAAASILWYLLHGWIALEYTKRAIIDAYLWLTWYPIESVDEAE